MHRQSGLVDKSRYSEQCVWFFAYFDLPSTNVILSGAKVTFGGEREIDRVLVCEASTKMFSALSVSICGTSWKYQEGETIFEVINSRARIR